MPWGNWIQPSFPRYKTTFYGLDGGTLRRYEIAERLTDGGEIIGSEDLLDLIQSSGWNSSSGAAVDTNDDTLSPLDQTEELAALDAAIAGVDNADAHVVTDTWSGTTYSAHRLHNKAIGLPGEATPVLSGNPEIGAQTETNALIGGVPAWVFGLDNSAYLADDRALDFEYNQDDLVNGQDLCTVLEASLTLIFVDAGLGLGDASTDDGSVTWQLRLPETGEYTISSGSSGARSVAWASRHHVGSNGDLLGEQPVADAPTPTAYVIPLDLAERISRAVQTAIPVSANLNAVRLAPGGPYAAAYNGGTRITFETTTPNMYVVQEATYRPPRIRLFYDTLTAPPRRIGQRSDGLTGGATRVVGGGNTVQRGLRVGPGAIL